MALNHQIYHFICVSAPAHEIMAWISGPKMFAHSPTRDAMELV
jgi:hypothetical protein